MDKAETISVFLLAHAFLETTIAVSFVESEHRILAFEVRTTVSGQEGAGFIFD